MIKCYIPLCLVSDSVGLELTELYDSMLGRNDFHDAVYPEVFSYVRYSGADP